MNDITTRKTSKAFKKIKTLVVATFIFTVMLAALSGCSGQISSGEVDDQPITASEYMVKLNQAADSLHENLDGFAVAVSEDDISTLKTKADSAFAAMESLDDLKVPDELVDVKNQYKEAVDTLHNALNDYITLFTEIQSEPDPEKVSDEKYAERFEKIQKDYDSGINLLEKADAAAKEL